MNKGYNQTLKVIVFDLDGTLFDTMTDFANQAALLIAKYYNTSYAYGRQIYLNSSGLPFYQQLEILFPGHVKNPEVVSEFERWKLENIADAPLRTHARETLVKLLNTGILLAISSNNMQANVNRMIKAARLPVTEIMGFRDEAFCKGQAHFTQFAKCFNCTMQEILFIGDSPNDYRIARQCGVNFLALLVTFSLQAFQEVHAEVQSVADLTEVPLYINNLNINLS